MAYYTTPQPGYVQYDYSSSSTSPGPDDRYDYYPPPQYRQPGLSRSGSKRTHVRAASYGTPRVANWHSPTTAAYASPGYYATMPSYSAPPMTTKLDYLNTPSPQARPRARRFSASNHDDARYSSRHHQPATPTHHARHASRAQLFEDRYHDSSSADEPMYTYIEPRSTRHASKGSGGAAPSSAKKTPRRADNFFSFSNSTTTNYETVDTPTRSRARRSSTSAGAAGAAAAAAAANKPKVSPAKAAKPTPVATAADAARHSIPAGYSLKNWDPTEEPILLLGSVFDANSLGKWIYDWTVYHHKGGSPLTEVAGELWLLLIKFAGKMKRADECLPRIRGKANREMVRDFYASGDRIWRRLKDLLKLCEEFMWMAAKKEGSASSSAKGKAKVSMGEKSGIEFVRSIFGRDRELERTEKLMTSVRLWNTRFDANCEEVLRRPSAS